jgi:hypothetical protein
MMSLNLEAPARGADLAAALSRSGYALLSGASSAELTGLDEAGWQELRQYWNSLPRDAYLKDAGRYRARRHASLVHDIATGGLQAVPHRAHWQPVQYNALHGGMSRRFEPLEEAFLAHPGVQRCITAIGEAAAGIAGVKRWFVEVHQVRIDTADGIGRPTPEGAHRDGVDFVAVWLAGRDDLRGGETRVFDADGPTGVRFTMRTPGTVMVLDDHRVIHETTPIQPGAAAGVRDTLIVTYRARGFQEPE